MKKKILGIGATVLILSAAVFAGCGLTGTRIRFGAAGLGGTYHVFADTFAGLITAGKEKCNILSYTGKSEWCSYRKWKIPEGL